MDLLVNEYNLLKRRMSTYVEIRSYARINRETGITDSKVIPEKYRGFIILKGEFVKWYKPYAKYSYTPYELYNNFPTWEFIANRIYKDDMWSKDDHLIYKEFLLWLTEGNWIVEFDVV